MKTVNGLIAAAITALAGCSTMPAPEYAVSNPIVQNSLSGMSCPEQPTIESVSASLQITAANLEAVLKNRAVSLKDFCAASADRKMRHLTKGVVARTGEYPGGADQYFRLLRMGGNVEGHQKRYSEAAKQAFEEREAALAELSTQPGFNRKGAAVWDNLGPGNVGGRIRSILVDPTNPNIVWLGAVTGGVWKSLDGGNSWRSTTDALGYVGIFSLTMMPGNPNTIFATTGEYAYWSGPGMIVTRDGGNSWSLIKPTGAAGEALTMARNLVIHPTQTNLMLVSAAYKGIWGSSDGGVTWQNISLTSGVQPSVTRLRQDPNNANNLIANTDYRGILVSGDFGLTWRYANGFPGTDQTDFRDIELAYSKSAPGRIYASITAKNGDTNRRYEIWRSDNGGKDWIYLSRAATSNWGATSRDQGSYNHVLWVNPTNANHILLGEIIVLQSLDGGNTWATVNDYATRPVSSVNSPFPEPAYANGGLNVWLHADHHVILTDPNFNGSTNRRVWFGNDGGIWRADDVTQLRVDPVSFTDYGTRVGPLKYLNNDLRIAQSYYVNGSAWLGGAILTGLQDNGTTMYRGDAANWWQPTGGDGMRAAFNPNNPFQFLTTYQQGAVSQVNLTETGVTSKMLWAGSASDPFFTYIEQNKNNPNRVYMMNTSLWASDDIWTSAPTRKQILGPDPTDAKNNIVAATVAPSNANVVWVIRQAGGLVQKTSNALDASPSWQSFNLFSGTYARGTRLFIDPSDSNRVYATFGYSQANKTILRTIDGGATWQDITGNLGNRYVYTVTQHPLKNTVLYAGTEFGLYTSENDGASWKLAPELAPGVAIEDLQWFDNRTLLIASYGRGVFRASNPSVEIVGDGAAQTISFPAGQSVRVSAGTTTPNASASSNLPLNFTSLTPSVCLANDRAVTLVKRGSCQLKAFQVGDRNYLPAEPVTQNIEVLDFSAQLVASTLPIIQAGQTYVGRLLIGGSQPPNSVSVSGLPAGLTATYDGLGNLTISGSTSAQPGTYSVSIRYTNSIESATLTTNIEVRARPSLSPPAATRVSSGRSHTCIVVNGGVQCWGGNSFGQLGTGNYSNSSLPTQVIAAGGNVTEISAGGYHTCAVVNGGAQCWGYNAYGQLGNNSTVSSNTPVQAIPSGSNVTAVSTGGYHTCAVVAGGVQCWGYNNNGQLGTGNTSNRSVPVSVISAGSNVTGIATGEYHTCAAVNGGVQCWGYGAFGQLGNNSSVSANSPVQAIAVGSGATSVAAGQWHSCAVVNGGLRCWGAGSDGRLGNGSTSQSSVPAQVVPSGTGVTAVAGGSSHTCFVIDSGVRCMGLNTSGQLGNSGASPSSVPLQTIPAKSGATIVATGAAHSCTIVNGQTLCWGNNASGQVGDGSSSTLPPTVAIAVGGNATAVSSSDGQTCALVRGGVSCWGTNEFGLGDGVSNHSTTPVSVVAASSGASSIAAGYQHVCAVVAGALRCWGDGRFGQLGNGSWTSASQPVQVITGNVGQVAAGRYHTCAVVSGGVQCWGSGGDGRLGNGGTSGSNTPVQAIAAGVGAVAVTAGDSHSCAVVSGGVRCWGWNASGQLGNNSTTDSNVPVQSIAAGTGATSVSAGAFHSCAVVNSGLQCWGFGGGGQLGNGSNSDSRVPVQVFAAGNSVTAVAVGLYHSCAIVAGGVKCWGSVSGINGTTYSNIPFDVIAPGSKATSIAAGQMHTCATVSDAVVCWGSNAMGQLGSSVGLYRKPTPVYYPGSADEPTPSPPAPTLVSPADQAVINGGSVDFSWSRVEGAAGYSFYIFNRTTGTDVLTPALPPTQTSTGFTVSNFGPGIYSWNVASCLSLAASSTTNCPNFSLTRTIRSLSGPIQLSRRGGIDIDGNGKSAIVVRSASAQLQVARLFNNQFQFSALQDPGPSYRLVGVGDFFRSGKSDLAFQNMTQGTFGDIKIWRGFSPSNEVFWRQVKQVWDVQAGGDLDGDGFGDLVWRYVVTDSPDTGVSYIWFTNGSAVTQVRKRGGAPLNWTLLGAADLNGDGAADMVYVSPANQARALMATANRTCANVLIGNIPTNLKALKLADFTGNGRGDILVRDNSTGLVSLIALNASGLSLPTYTGLPDDQNASCTSSALQVTSTTLPILTADPSWQFYAAGDFNGDGIMDVVWKRTDGTLTLWLLNDNGAAPTVIANAGSSPSGFVPVQP